MGKKNTVDILRYMDYAGERGFDPEELLKFELSDTAHYLEKQGKKGLSNELKKSNKSELLNGLIQLLPSKSRNVHHPSYEMLVVDFMGLIRKLPVKKMKLQTYGDLMEAVLTGIKALVSDTTTRIDIVFDMYLDRSIKDFERERRSTKEKIM